MGDVSRVSKASHVPLYYQLAVILENRVEAGDYDPWERFPSEHELCEEFDVSRAVVRPAIAILEREGRLERVKGKGTFVRPPKALHKLGGLSRVIADRHPESTTLEVIEVRNEASNPEVAQVLSPPLRRVTALMRTDGEPRALFWTFLSEDVTWADDLSEGPPVPIEEFGSDLLLAEGDCVIESSWSTDFESSCLEIPGGTPILVAHCTEVAHFAKPPELRNVEVAWVICRADAMRVRAKLGAAAMAAPKRPTA
jgi:GntR family transcriptional regulator